MGIREGKFVDLGMPSSGKKAFLWTTENNAMSGSRASQEHEQRPCVDMVHRSGHLYWMIRIPASQHLRRMGATATSVSRVESVSGVGPSHTLRMGSTPSSGYGTQHTTTSSKSIRGSSTITKSRSFCRPRPNPMPIWVPKHCYQDAP